MFRPKGRIPRPPCGEVVKFPVERIDCPALQLPAHVACRLSSRAGPWDAELASSVAVDLQPRYEAGHAATPEGLLPEAASDGSRWRSTFEGSQGQAHAGHDGIPATLFLLRVSQIEAMDRHPPSPRKVAAAV